MGNRGIFTIRSFTFLPLRPMEKSGRNLVFYIEYDQNGNMTSDANKGITDIDYNHLNLPTKVTINNGSDNGTIDYVYDAIGMKLRKEVSGSSTGTTEYAGNYVYKNGQLQFFDHPEGYVEPDGSGGYNYIYNYLDNVGNVRLSYTDADGNGSIDPANEIIEENNYYPFGLKHKGYNEAVSPLGNSTAKNFRYNGQELEESLGFDMYEMDMRQYDPAIGRWVVQDPIISFKHSPYAGFDNNPVVFADPSGAKVIIKDDGNSITFTGADAVDAFKILTNNTGESDDDSDDDNDNNDNDDTKKARRLGEQYKANERKNVALSTIAYILERSDPTYGGLVAQVKDELRSKYWKGDKEEFEEWIDAFADALGEIRSLGASEVPTETVGKPKKLAPQVETVVFALKLKIYAKAAELAITNEIIGARIKRLDKNVYKEVVDPTFKTGDEGGGFGGGGASGSFGSDSGSIDTSVFERFKKD